MTLEKNMEKLLDIDTESVVEEDTLVKNVTKDNPDVQKDYEYTRGELYSIIDQGQEAVRGALEVAQESGHPRAYEVATNAMKQVADMTDKLMDLQKKVKDLDEEKKGPKSVTNNAMSVSYTHLTLPTSDLV